MLRALGVLWLFSVMDRAGAQGAYSLHPATPISVEGLLDASETGNIDMARKE